MYTLTNNCHPFLLALLVSDACTAMVGDAGEMMDGEVSLLPPNISSRSYNVTRLEYE